MEQKKRKMDLNGEEREGTGMAPWKVDRLSAVPSYVDFLVRDWPKVLARARGSLT